MDCSHKKLGITAELKDFSQAQYEKYHDELFPFQGMPAAKTNGAIVKAAIKAGFLIGVDVEKVGSMSPAAIVWLDKKIHEHVTAITTPPADDDPN